MIERFVDIIKGYYCIMSWFSVNRFTLLLTSKVHLILVRIRGRVTECATCRPKPNFKLSAILTVILSLNIR